TRTRFINDFVRRGIDRSRLDFLGDLEITADNAQLTGRWHLPLYRSIDICLDTFPWSGHTSACEAIWMGAPVLSLRGHTRAGRMVASVLTQIGREEWIAQTREEFVTKAVEMSRSRDELRSGRRALRETMTRSQLCDARRFAQDWEAALRAVWNDW